MPKIHVPFLLASGVECTLFHLYYCVVIDSGVPENKYVVTKKFFPLHFNGNFKVYNSLRGIYMKFSVYGDVISPLFFSLVEIWSARDPLLIGLPM